METKNVKTEIVNGNYGKQFVFEQIFSVTKLKDGNIQWQEGCDKWLEEDLTVEESLQLLDEIREFINAVE